MTTNDDLISKFIRQAKTETKVTPPVSSRKQRILTGVLVSSFIMATHSLIAETINILKYPELPLHFHPFGMIGNILYMLFIAALTGIALGWSKKATTGITTGSIVFFLGLEVRQFLSSAFSFSLLLPELSGILAFPSIIFEIVLLGLLTGLARLAIDLHLEKAYLKFWSWQKTYPVLLLLVIAIGLGYLRQIPVEWGYSLRATDALIKEGLNARDISELPTGLNEKPIRAYFLKYSDEHYKLEVNNLYESLFFVVYPDFKVTFRHNVVIVYFDNGHDIACLISGGQSARCMPIHRKIKYPPFIL